MEQGHSVSPHKVWRKAFHGRWGPNCFGQICWGTVLQGRLMIDYGKARGVSQMYFSVI